VAEKEFYDFDEALDALRLKEEELKRLVSEGEIRAFRDGDTMKLRRADVENLKKELLGGELVDLGTSTGEELVFEDDADFEETGMATEEISEMDTVLEEGVEDVGEIEIAEEAVEPVAAAVPVRRGAAVVVEPETESMAMRAVLILTTLVLILAMPVAISVSTGAPGGIAKGIAGLFGKDLP
jgi:excisionase family DNA binding protein